MVRQPDDDPIDRLYQLPLNEFTAARNTLAKELGTRAPDIKRLEKPSAAAWAVNQLFWRERKIHDDVMGASERLRDAYRQQLAGQVTDLKGAEATHRDALRKAMHTVRAILEGSGASASDAVMTAVTETLDALPGSVQAGRLTTSLRRTGFEALQGVTIAPATRPDRPTKPPAKKSPAEASVRTDTGRQESEAAQRERAMTVERLRFAEAAERETEAALERTRRAIERADRVRERLQRELDEATQAAATLATEEATRTAAHDKAVTERENLTKKLLTLNS